MAKIFISYSSRDKDVVRQLATDLQEIGHKPWLDEWEIKVGECIVTKIEEGVSKSDYVVIILTPHSISSGWVDKEWETAYWSEIEQNKILVLPILFEDCDIPPLLKTKKYADFRRSYAVGFAQLIQAILPSYSEEHKPSMPKPPRTDKEVTDLILKVQGKTTPLSQCMSEALVIAQNYEDKSFVEFCKSEIIGWDTKKLPKDKSLDYRLILAYCSIAEKINPNYIGWGETPSAMFS